MLDYFVQVESGLPGSKLVDRMRAQLGVGKAEAVGLLTCLWLGVMATRSGGQVGERSDAWIEDAAGWRGEFGVFAGFIRDHHLTRDGVIRDWLERYGTLEAQRAQAAERKRNHRKAIRELSPGQSRGRPRDVPVPEPGRSRSGHADVPPSVTGAATNRSPSPPVVEVPAVQETSTTHSSSRVRVEPLIHGIQPGEFGEAEDAIVAMLATARPAKAMGAVATLRLMRDGERGYEKFPLSAFARAAGEYAASMEAPDHFAPDLFTRFLRRAAKATERTNGRKALAVEARAIEQAQDEGTILRQEEAEADQLLADFERTNEARYAELLTLAERDVPATVKGPIRTVMVRSALITRIRQEKPRAR